MTKRPTDSGLPSRDPGRALDDDPERQPHTHTHSDGGTHRHRMGLIDHEHDENGRPVFGTDAAKFRAANPAAASSPPDGAAPRVGPTPAVPDAPAASEPSDAGISPAESSGSDTSGPGRPLTPSDPAEVAAVVAGAKEYTKGLEQVAQAIDAPGGRFGNPSAAARNELVRPNASASVVAALGGVYNPAADPGYALRLADTFQLIIVAGQTYGRIVQANADKLPPDPDDVREWYRTARQIAATHGIDLDDNGEGS